jgi:hypothetical protein
MEAFKDVFLSTQCQFTYPWLTLPRFDDDTKHYKYNEEGAHDSEREKIWVNCKKRRSLELMTFGVLIAIIILLLAPSQLEPYIDIVGYGIIGVSIFGYLTSELRARNAYMLYVNERTMSGFNQKEFVNFKKKNFGPSVFELF